MVTSLPVESHSTPPPPAAAPSSTTVFPGLRQQAHYEAAAFLRAVRLGGLTAAEVESVIEIDPDQRARLLEFAGESGERTARMVHRSLELREATLKEFQRLVRAKTLPFPAGRRRRILGQNSLAETFGTSLYLHCRRPRAKASPGQSRAAGAVAGRSSEPNGSGPKRRDLPAVELTCAGSSECFQSWVYQVGVLALSRALAVHRTTVSSWLSAKRTPEPKHARIIIALSKIVPLSHGASRHPLTYEDVYGRVEARPIALQGEACASGV